MALTIYDGDGGEITVGQTLYAMDPRSGQLLTFTVLYLVERPFPDDVQYPRSRVGTNLLEEIPAYRCYPSKFRAIQANEDEASAKYAAHSKDIEYHAERVGVYATILEGCRRARQKCWDSVDQQLKEMGHDMIQESEGNHE
jgi:hypothetical protein